MPLAGILVARGDHHQNALAVCIVNGLFHRHRVGGESPTARDHVRPVVHGIIDGLGAAEDVTIAIGVQVLSRHDPGRGTDARDIDAVVHLGGDDPGAVGAMATVIQRVDRAFAVIVYGEIVSVDIIDVSIPIVVDVRLAVPLCDIDPHPVGQVAVVVIHAAIHHGNHNLSITGVHFPGRFDGDIRPGRARARRTASSKR